MSAVMAPAHIASSPLGRLGRIIGTGLSFVIFGVVCFVCGITLFPAVCLSARGAEASKIRGQKLVYHWFGLFSHIMRVLGVLTWEIHGAEKLRGRGQLVIANHPTLVDVVLLLGYIPRIDCIVKEALFHNIFTRFPITWAGYISNSTPSQLLSDCVKSLKDGNSLLIFPEGTRSVTGKPLHMQHSVARIALEAGVPVLPVSIRCEPIMLMKNNPWYRVPARRGHYTITVGDPVSVEHYLKEAPNPSVAARRLTRDWEQYFTQRIGASNGPA